jgi:type IV pilus assembly protein PilM
MIFPKKLLLGVDLGTRTIKGVQLKQGKNGKVLLHKHFFQDLALISEQYPADCNREEAFKAALEIQSLVSSQAASAIKDSKVMSFQLELPTMSDKELIQVVPQEVAEQGQLNMDEHSFDFIVQPNGVKAFCVKKSVVLDQMKLLEDAGLRPSSIESEMMAITSMLEFNGYLEPKEVVVVVDLGDSYMNSSLIVDGAPSIQRTCLSSFGSINQTLRDRCNLSYRQAEKVKVDYDFLVGPGAEKTELTSVLDDAFTEIFKSIKGDIEFFQECSESGGRVDRILLVGGGSQMKSAAKVIEKFLKVPATVVNPFRNIDIFLDKTSVEEIASLAPYMGTAVGLALASIPKGKAA